MTRKPQIEKSKIKLINKNSENVKWRAIFNLVDVDQMISIPVEINPEYWSYGDFSILNSENKWLKKQIPDLISDQIAIQIIATIRDNSKYKKQFQGIDKIKFKSKYEQEKFNKHNFEIIE